MSSTTTPKRAGLDAYYTPDDVAQPGHPLMLPNSATPTPWRTP